MKISGSKLQREFFYFEIYLKDFLDGFVALTIGFSVFREIEITLSDIN